MSKSGAVYLSSSLLVFLIVTLVFARSKDISESDVLTCTLFLDISYIFSTFQKAVVHG